MFPGGYTVEVTSLSPIATEKDIYDFFIHCGVIDHIEIVRCGEYACTAYVTFKDAYALETAVLLSGAKIADQYACISRWEAYVDEADPGMFNPHEHSGSMVHMGQLVSSPGEAVTITQEVVKTMLAKGYVLSKDALAKAKQLDDSYSLSASARAKVAELSNRIGLTDSINTGVEVFKSVDEKYHVSDITKSAATVVGTTAVVAATVTGKAAVAATTAVVNSSYFSKGALWVSDALARAAKTAADLGGQSK